jgi:hypothetical protein
VIVGYFVIADGIRLASGLYNDAAFYETEAAMRTSVAWLRDHTAVKVYKVTEMEHHERKLR